MKRKREIIFAIAILLIATLAYIFGWTGIFTVQKIEVSGTSDSAVITKVLELSDIQNGDKMARIEPRNISNRLVEAGIDWIESIKVSRNWITRSVNIKITPRVPIAITGDKYVDVTGREFKLPPSIPLPTKTELIQLSAKDDPGRKAAIAFYGALSPEFQAKVEKLISISTENFQILTKEKLRIIWGANSNNELKLKIYKALLAFPENSKIKLMDLSDPNKPTVK